MLSDFLITIKRMCVDMGNERVKNLIDRFEKEYLKFMCIENFPKYKIEFFESKMDEVNAAGFGAVAQTKYNPKTDEHTLYICSNLELKKYIIFHEFTHILDAEMYAKRDSTRYVYLSGFTEYHASQVELMCLLGAKNVHSKEFSFSFSDFIETFPSRMRVEEYLNSKHRFVSKMLDRQDFPVDFNALKTTLGVLYNYFGLRSICKMYATDFVEQVDNTSIIKMFPSQLFHVLNVLMEGWFDKVKVEMSFGPYSNAIMPIVKSHKLL